MEPGDLNKSPPNLRLPLALINLLQLSLHFCKLGSDLLIKNVTLKLGLWVMFFFIREKNPPSISPLFDQEVVYVLT